MLLSGLFTSSTQAPHEHGVVRQSLGIIEQAPEELVVTSRSQVELSADRLFFRTAVAAPLTLEGEESAITVRQRHIVTLLRAAR